MLGRTGRKPRGLPLRLLTQKFKVKICRGEVRPGHEKSPESTVEEHHFCLLNTRRKNKKMKKTLFFTCIEASSRVQPHVKRSGACRLQHVVRQQTLACS
jgi:hypothetical protein